MSIEGMLRIPWCTTIRWCAKDIKKAARNLLCGGGMAWAPGEGGGGGGVPEMGCCAAPFVLCKDVAAKGAGTQILARKIFFTKKCSPTYV